MMSWRLDLNNIYPDRFTWGSSRERSENKQIFFSWFCLNYSDVRFPSTSRKISWRSRTQINRCQRPMTWTSGLDSCCQAGPKGGEPEITLFCLVRKPLEGGREIGRIGSPISVVIILSQSFKFHKNATITVQARDVTELAVVDVTLWRWLHIITCYFFSLSHDAARLPM